MRNFLISLSSFLLPTLAFAADPLIGTTWKTIDDKTNQPSAIVKFSEEKNGQLTATIQKILIKNEEQKCTSCQGQYQNKSLIGLSIIKGLKKIKPNEYGEGKILDPQNGKTYSFNLCTRQISQNPYPIRILLS